METLLPINKTILVYGYYSGDYKLGFNLGDELFIDAFKTLFPKFNFKFTNHITADMLKNISVIFFGGGSFLDGKPNITDDALNILKSKTILYIGIGAETNIHQYHIELMKIAKLIAIRSPDHLEKIKKLNNNAITIPDLIYSLFILFSNTSKEKSILIIPNFAVVPQNNDPHWKHASWNYFKSEFSQFIDELIDYNYLITFLSFCNNSDANDEFAAIEIMNSMKNRKKCKKETAHHLNHIAKNKYIITQRYHGIILAELANKKHIVISHHDKLKNHSPKIGSFLSYYECSKTNLFNNFNEEIKKDYVKLPLKNNMFEELILRTEDIVRMS